MNIMKCLYFIDLTIFRGQGRNSYNNFVGFLVEMMPSKSPFEINWPLSSIEFGKSFNLLCVTYISFVVRHYNWANLLLIFFHFFCNGIAKISTSKILNKIKMNSSLEIFCNQMHVSICLIFYWLVKKYLQFLL